MIAIAREALGYTPRIGLEQGMLRTERRLAREGLLGERRRQEASDE